MNAPLFTHATTPLALNAATARRAVEAMPAGCDTMLVRFGVARPLDLVVTTYPTPLPRRGGNRSRGE